MWGGYKPRIKVDGDFHHGSSGGAVVDSEGKLIGIISNGNAVGGINAVDSLFIPLETVLTAYNN